MSEQIDNAIASMRIDVTEIQKSVARQEVLVSRFDTAIDKISEVTVNVSKLLAVHEQRIESQEIVSKSIQDNIEKRRKEHDDALTLVYEKLASQEQGIRAEMSDHHKEILGEIKSLRSDMTELGTELKDQQEEIRDDIEKDFTTKIDVVSERVNKLERMSWLVVGGAAVVGFILSQAVGIIDLLK
jgi:hypothetical protein